jgi:hypothetical protein
MFILRIVAGWCLIVAVMALVYDASLIAQGVYGLSSLGQHWLALGPDSYNGMRAAVERLHPLLWSPVLTTLLALPAFIVFGLLGAALYTIGRRRSSINVFAN